MLDPGANVLITLSAFAFFDNHFKSLGQGIHHECRVLGDMHMQCFLHFEYTSQNTIAIVVKG